MKLPTDLRRPSLRLALLCAVTLVLGLLLPVYSMASQDGSRAEERATNAEEQRTAHAEERAARAEERATREQEREARRTARSEEQAARRNARKAGRDGSSEAGEAGGKAGEANGKSGEAEGKSGADPSPSGSGSGAPPAGKLERGCLLSIQASSNRIIAGETVTVSGALTCPTGASAADQQVTVYQRQGGAGASGARTDSIAGTATTQADGSYELTPIALNTNTVFQVRLGKRRARTVIKVAPLVTLTAPSPADAQISTAGAHPHKHTRVTFTGTVSPADAGALVALQVSYPTSDANWRSVAFGRVAADGGYSIAHAFRAPGQASLRVVAHTGRLNVPGVSEPISYEATQTQNPQLTIATSADPIDSGQPVTISGIATGTANQPVELLARTHGGAYAIVAESTTNAGGDYTFTQEPLQNTSYRVTDAAAQSTTLFEGVGFVLATTEPPPATAQVGQPLTFSGTLSPAAEGQVVYLERERASGVGFDVLGVGTVNATSQYQISYAFARAGASVMRIRIRGDDRHQGSATAPFTITVTG